MLVLICPPGRLLGDCLAQQTADTLTSGLESRWLFCDSCSPCPRLPSLHPQACCQVPILALVGANQAPEQGPAWLSLGKGGQLAQRGLSRGRRVWWGRGGPDLPAFRPRRCSCARASWSGVGPGHQSGGGTRKTPCGQGNLGRQEPRARPVSLVCSQGTMS